MVTKKPNLISIPLHDLIKCLVDYSEFLDTPPPDSETIPDSDAKPNKRSFILDTPEQKLNAIETILFGDDEEKKKRGNKSFEEYDRELILELYEEHKNKIKTKEDLLEICVPCATLRGEKTSDESVRTRLEKVYQKIKKSGGFNQSTGPVVDLGEATGFEGYEAEEIRILTPFLEKYREEILCYYLSEPKEDIDIEKLPSWLQKIYKDTPQ